MSIEAVNNLISHLEERMKQLKAAEEKAHSSTMMAYRLASALDCYLKDLKTRQDAKEVLEDYKAKFETGSEPESK